MIIENVPTSTYELAFLELQKSNVYHKIPEHQIDFYINESIKIGQEIANKFKGMDIIKLLEGNNIQLIQRKTNTVGGKVVLRGEIHFTNKKSSITVYEESLASMIKDCNPILPEHLKLTTEQFFQMHIAHEFFHFYEFSTNQSVAEMLPKIKLGNFFKWKREANIIQCSEIAAHVFAKEIGNLAILPNYYDFVYLKTCSI